MKSKQIAQLIRKIVKEEVQKEVRNMLLEQASRQVAHVDTLPNTQEVQPVVHEHKQYTSNSALNDILNETVESTSYETLKTFNSDDARAGFASMQPSMNAAHVNPIPNKDVNGAPINPNKVTPDVMKALTRNYSELVKRF
jgi:hypothetical protein